MMNHRSARQQLGPRFVDSLSYACALHAGQVRKGTDIPYIAHLLSVAALVIENGGDQDVAIAAVLHDAVEDQGGAATREEIRRRFGERVAAIVDGCSDADVMPKPPWRERKEEYIRHLRLASDDTRLVSLADKLHNARSILSDYRQVGEPLWERFSGGREGTLWYYRTLVDVFQELSAGSLADELSRVVSELEYLTFEPGNSISRQ